MQILYSSTSLDGIVGYRLYVVSKFAVFLFNDAKKAGLGLAVDVSE